MRIEQPSERAPPLRCSRHAFRPSSCRQKLTHHRALAVPLVIELETARENCLGARVFACLLPVAAADGRAYGAEGILQQARLREAEPASVARIAVREPVLGVFGSFCFGARPEGVALKTKNQKHPKTSSSDTNGAKNQKPKTKNHLRR